MTASSAAATLSSVGALFSQAVNFFQLGQIDTAAALCQKIIQLEPRHGDALHVLGIVALQKGEGTRGAEFIRRSLEIDPSQPHVHCSLGNAFRDLGQPAEAVRSYRRALELAPGFFGALYGEGNALMDLGNPGAALESYDRALLSHPDHPKSHQNRGNALLSLGRPEEALASYQRAAALEPKGTDALINCAHVLRRLDRREEALEVYHRLSALRPDDVDVLIDRGRLQYELGRFEEAAATLNSALLRRPDAALARQIRADAWLRLQQFTRALADFDQLLQADPILAETHCKRGECLLGLERPSEALKSFDAALRCKPDLLQAADGRGNALRALQRFDEALAAVEHALTLAPDSPDMLYRRAAALRNLGRHEEAAAAFAAVVRVAPHYHYALGNLLHEKLQICDWSGYEETVARVIQPVTGAGRSCTPGMFLSVSDSPSAQQQCARTYMADRHPASRAAASTGGAAGLERIRVAYVSADFRPHPVAYLMAGVFEHHDRRRFETIAVSLASRDGSAMGQRLEGAFAQFIDVSQKSDREVYSLLRELEVDIVVDLAGLSGVGRPDLFTSRPAPVQVNFLGYSGTLGTACYDYIIADRIVIPEADRAFYDEKVVYLPHSFQPNDAQRPIAERTPTRAECGLPERGIVFCCFNTHYKINPPVFDVWMRLLGAVDGSVLWLAAGSATVTRNLRHEAAARGISPDRLVFAERLPEMADHLARYRLADLFLDTLPFNAHATASDALWAGVPVLTCAGGAYAARVGASLLTAVGCPELITSSLEEYEALARRLANDAVLLGELRARLARNRTTTPLFDTQRYCRDLESAYVTMWERCQRAEAPQSFAVR